MPSVATLGIIFILLWIVILGIYLYSSSRQQDLRQELEKLEKALGRDEEVERG